jgi:hypothetical protein
MTANRERGEVELAIAGSTYVLCLDTSAMMRIETHINADPEWAPVRERLYRAAREAALQQWALECSAARLAKRPEPRRPEPPDGEITWDQFWAMVLRGSVRSIVALVWGMLGKYHREVDLAAAFALIDASGGLEKMSNAILMAATAARPAVADAKALKVGKADSKPAGRRPTRAKPAR